jgi:hypothetical protein
MDGNMVRVVDRNDSTLWTYTPTGFTNFRGAVVADVNNDHIKDVTFCTDYGTVISLDGMTGAVIRTFDLYNYAVTVLGDTSSIFEVDNAPIIADFDGDGILDLFIIGGKGRSDSTSYNDYGYAFCLSWGAGHGPAWTMFRHDGRRTGCLCDTNGLPLAIQYTTENNLAPDIIPNPSAGEFSISFSLAVGQPISISVTDMTGRIVIPASQKYYPQGACSMHFDKTKTLGLNNGPYLVQIKGNEINTTKKLVIYRK